MVLIFCREVVEIIFWMMEVCVDGTFFAFTGGSGLVTWTELTLKREIGNSALCGEDFGGSGPLKKKLYLTTENNVVLKADWEPDAILPDLFSIAASLFRK